MPSPGYPQIRFTPTAQGGQAANHQLSSTSDLAN
jgi:hypothetical protein